MNTLTQITRHRRLFALIHQSARQDHLRAAEHQQVRYSAELMDTLMARAVASLRPSPTTPHI